jgi:transglutaminase-like putative cysteine protease
MFVVDATAPSYLRLSTLARFDGEVWGLPEFVLSRVDRGLSTPRDGDVEIRQTIRIVDLGGVLVPAAADPVAATGSDDLRWSADSSTLVKIGGNLESGEVYEIVSTSPRFDVGDLQVATSRTPGDLIYLELPDDVPASVGTLARNVTDGATTPYETALTLQDWFRTEFEYSLEVQAGHGNAAMESFLQDRVGYAEQFAGTYAVMMRLLGIPARVAFGFTPGVDAGDQGASVLGEHAHAWPEVWFDGLGWVPFEPTPGIGAPGAENSTNVVAQQSETETTDDTPSQAIQRTPIAPIGAPIEPDQSGTLIGDTISLDWDGITASTDFIAFPGTRLYVTASPTGYLMMDLSAMDAQVDEPTGPKFWRSTDGIGWSATESFTFEPSPSGNMDQADAIYRQIGDDHWIVGFNGAGAWRSTDTVEWTSIDGPETARFRGDLHDVGGRALWIESSGSAYWFSPDTATWIADPDVVVPRRSTSPATVGDRTVIAGTEELSIITPEGTARIPSPWIADQAYIEAVGDTFVAYTGGDISDCCFEFDTGRELTLEQIWTSTDGVEWAGPLVPDFIDGPTPALFIDNNGVGAILTQNGLWTTRNWVDWTDAGVVPSLNDGDAITFGDGALLVQDGNRAWFSPDMEAWHEIPTDDLALGEQWSPGRVKVLAVDDLAYIVRNVFPEIEDGGPYYWADVRIIRQP